MRERYDVIVVGARVGGSARAQESVDFMERKKVSDVLWNGDRVVGVKLAHGAQRTRRGRRRRRRSQLGCLQAR